MKFIDANGRSIEIGGDFDIEAFHDGMPIGSIEFDSDGCGTSLFGMHVDSVYRQAGIGTAMMRAAADLHGKRFRKPSLLAVGGRHAESSEYYTQEGAALIGRCIQLGILDDTEPSEMDDFNDY